MDHAPDAPVPSAGEHGDGEARERYEPHGEPETTPGFESTGVASVDRVLGEVAAVADAPVSEHVEVFERAHEQLRRALDAPPGPAADGAQGA
jgi:hypothetical protein